MSPRLVITQKPQCPGSPATTGKLTIADDTVGEVDDDRNVAKSVVKRHRGRPAGSDGQTAQRILAAAQDLAVFDEVEQAVFDRFRAAATGQSTFVGKIEAVLDEAVRLSRSNPTVAGFLLSVSGDLARQPDLLEAVETAWARRDEFLGEVVEAGIATREIAPADWAGCSICR